MRETFSSQPETLYVLLFKKSFIYTLPQAMYACRNMHALLTQDTTGGRDNLTRVAVWADFLSYACVQYPYASHVHPLP